MVCHPCLETGNLSEEAYGRRVTGEGPTYREGLKGQVSCEACGELLAAGSLLIHMMTQHGRLAEICQQWSTPATGNGPQTFRMTFPAKGAPQNFPVAGFPGRVATRTAMQVHLFYRHVLDTVVILEEGNFPHPRCARCDMLVPRQALNGRHPVTAQCARGEEWKRRRFEEAEARESSERAFEAYGKPLKNVLTFRYLGRVLMTGDDDWIALVVNLEKARKSWGRLSWVLVREGADPKVSGNFYKAVSQAVLVFGAET